MADIIPPNDMEINSNMKVGAVNGVATARRSSAASGASEAADPFANSTALDGALKSVPDVRPEAVERAKQLINDPGYPSAGTIKTLSNFLADKLTSAQE
jgi:hypothetical protein